MKHPLPPRTLYRVKNILGHATMEVWDYCALGAKFACEKEVGPEKFLRAWPACRVPKKKSKA